MSVPAFAFLLCRRPLTAVGTRLHRPANLNPMSIPPQFLGLADHRYRFPLAGLVQIHGESNVVHRHPLFPHPHNRVPEIHIERHLSLKTHAALAHRMSGRACGI